MNALRSLLYALARVLGDASAVLNGTILQRLARKSLFRTSGKWINRIR